MRAFVPELFFSDIPGFTLHKTGPGFIVPMLYLDPKDVVSWPAPKTAL